MNTPLVHDRNTDQAAYWNGPAGRRWIERQETQDVVLAPASAVLFERALVGEGNRVIDVGCGCGETTIALAKRVGPKGHVTGVDISAPMLARARERADTGLPLNFVLADRHAAPVAAIVGSPRILLPAGRSKLGVWCCGRPGQRAGWGSQGQVAARL